MEQRTDRAGGILKAGPFPRASNFPQRLMVSPVSGAAAPSSGVAKLKVLHSQRAVPHRLSFSLNSQCVLRQEKNPQISSNMANDHRE